MWLRDRGSRRKTRWSKKDQRVVRRRGAVDDPRETIVRPTVGTKYRGRSGETGPSVVPEGTVLRLSVVVQEST